MAAQTSLEASDIRHADKGIRDVDLYYKFNTLPSQVGGEVGLHIPLDDLKEHFGTKVADYFNPLSVQIRAKSTAGSFDGHLVTKIDHGAKPRKHTIYQPTQQQFSVDQSDRASRNHISIEHGEETERSFDTVPSEEQHPSYKDYNDRKLKWADMSLANLDAGVYPVSDEHSLVATHDEKGLPGVVGRYSMNNRNDPTWYDGMYADPKLLDIPGTHLKGFAMNNKHIEEVQNSVKKVLTQHNPLRDGLGVVLTRTSLSPSKDNGNVRLWVRVKRQPLDATKGGYVPREDAVNNVITEEQMAQAMATAANDEAGIAYNPEELTEENSAGYTAQALADLGITTKSELDAHIAKFRAAKKTA